MRDRFILFAVLGALSFQGAKAYGQLQEGGWPMVMRDARHTSRSPCVGAATSMLKWTYGLGDGGGCYAWMAIDSSGVIYVPMLDSLLAMNPDGTPKWICYLRAWTTPAIDANGTIYVGSNHGLYAVSSVGVEQWLYATHGWIYGSSPMIGPDGTIYVGCTDDTLHAVNPDGTRKWVYPTGGRVQCCPAIGLDGTIYVGSYDDSLHAVNLDGTRKWAFHVGGELWSSPAVGKDGTIYIGSADAPEICCLFAVNPDGTEKWTYPVTDWILSSPGIAPDGTIYVVGYDDTLHAVNPDGTRKWARYMYKTADWLAVDANGTVYIANRDLWAINADGTLKWCLENGSIWQSPAIGPDGTIYTASCGPIATPDTLYAVGPGQPIGGSKGLRLSYARPNPFRQLTTIDYSILRAAEVTLRIYDVTGRMVKELVNREQKAGMHTVTWEGKTPRSKELATGVYFVRLCAGDEAATRKLILVH